jgi:hypothetical protein
VSCNIIAFILVTFNPVRMVIVFVGVILIFMWLSSKVIVELINLSYNIDNRISYGVLLKI